MATKTDTSSDRPSLTDTLGKTDRFEKSSRGVSAPNSGADTADHPEDPGSVCENCGHVGHEHDKERVYPDDGPAGSYHHRYICPS